ncbi:Sodium-coupled monocarboxylate transporter 1, partial [Fasciola gigantica]
GGIRAVVWTDAIQLTVLTTGLLLIAILGIKQVGGIERLWTVALEGKRLQSFKAILLNIPFNAVFLAIQLFCGLVVYACFIGCDPLLSGLISRHDQLLPYFVMLIFENTPVIRGLFLSVIFAAALSTVSSGVNSLANVWIEDLIQPWNKIICGRSIRPRTKSLLAVALCKLHSRYTIVFPRSE